MWINSKQFDTFITTNEHRHKISASLSACCWRESLEKCRIWCSQKVIEQVFCTYSSSSLVGTMSAQVYTDSRKRSKPCTLTMTKLLPSPASSTFICYETATQTNVFLAKLLNEGIPIRIYKKLKHFYFQIFFVLINLFSENHFLYYFFPLVVIVSLIIMTYNKFEWMCVVLQIQIPFQPPQCPKVPTAV